MRAHDGGVEHLKEMRRGAHGRKRVEECFENAALAQSIEACSCERKPLRFRGGENKKRTFP
jgi:hypothetical protein